MKTAKRDFLEQQETQMDWGRRGTGEGGTVGTFCLSSLHSLLSLSTEMFRAPFPANQGLWSLCLSLL